MIINTGMRTDIVQYYTPWLLKRFEEGYVFSRNPIYNYIVHKNIKKIKKYIDFLLKLNYNSIIL